MFKVIVTKNSVVKNICAKLSPPAKIWKCNQFESANNYIWFGLLRPCHISVKYYSMHCLWDGDSSNNHADSRLAWLRPDRSHRTQEADLAWSRSEQKCEASSSNGAFVSERRVSIYIVEITRAGGGIAPLASGWESLCRKSEVWAGWQSARGRHATCLPSHRQQGTRNQKNI